MTTTETETAIIPDFGDDAEDRKIAFVCSKGTLDMAYPALIMASGALEQGVETHIFFTFWGMDMINKQMDELDIPDVPTFLSHLSDMGCHLWACKMSVDMFELTEDDMTDDLEGVLNVGDFIEIIDGAQTMFI